MQNQIYHYKFQGEWIPFSLTEEDGIKWRNFCAKIAILRHENPNEKDYKEFLNILKAENLDRGQNEPRVWCRSVYHNGR